MYRPRSVVATWPIVTSPIADDPSVNETVTVKALPCANALGLGSARKSLNMPGLPTWKFNEPSASLSNGPSREPATPTTHSGTGELFGTVSQRLPFGPTTSTLV